MTEEHKSAVAETIGEISDFAQKNPEIAKTFAEKFGNGWMYFLGFAGIGFGALLAYLSFTLLQKLV